MTNPIQAARPPARRPAVEGRTMMTFAWSQGPRQSVVRTWKPCSAAPARSSSNCQAWSVPGFLRASPQQQPRQTTTVQEAEPIREVRGVEGMGEA
ncbi:UNVERIFIED_CONTAM: hypothetical protein RKD50_008053 [Streptomyces canus]